MPDNAPADQPNKATEPYEEVPPVETQHTLDLPGRTLAYTARAGMLPLKDEKGEVKAEIFHVSYTLDGSHPDRPLIIAFNGGPGSASVWLHLGALGPYRAAMEDEGFLPAPPYRLEPNAETWLDFADLLFIDPVGTGYSRALDPEKNKDYWSLDADLDSVAEAIRLYLVRSGRWASPLYLCGESYGTTRAAGLSGKLVRMGVGLSGVILISTILNFQTARFTPGNDLPYPLFLPTYTATAWYHGKLPTDLQERPLRDVLGEVEVWASGPYASALFMGDALPADQRAAVIQTLARYTGLPQSHIDLSDLRVRIDRFCKELRRDERRVVGRLDTRFAGIDGNPLAEGFEMDPSMTAIFFPYATLMNTYARGTLGYETDRPYEILSFDVNHKWEWPRGEFPNTTGGLRTALHQNRHMRVFIGQGYYDLATPYYAAAYTFDHMGLDPALRDHLTTFYYEAGHMMYIQAESMAQLRADVLGWLEA